MTDDLFSREEVLGGLPAGRARTLLFSIESRTAQRVANTRQAMERFLTDDAAQEREMAFLEAFALGREPPLRPTIQDIDRFAEDWAPLVAANPRLQAALAHALGEKYRFRRSDIGGIRRAVHLDDQSVQRAYSQLYGHALASIYQPKLAPVEQLRWLLSAVSRRLETLPPFWTAFALTLTETVGAGLVGLPIGIAHVGLLPGLVLLVVFGVINMITIASISEAVARNGSVRYGETFFGKVVGEYLGGFASSVTSGILIALIMLVLVAYYVGVSTTLEHTIHLPAVVGTAIVFAFGMFLVTRKSLNATITSALIVGGINIALILAMGLLALPHLQPANLTYAHVPFYRGTPFEPSLLATIVGLILAAYFGHLSMGNCAHVVLRRDPSGRSFMFGGVAAQSAAMAIYCVWIFCINGSIPRALLSDQQSTALVPLAHVVGPSVVILGAVYVAMAMGMASVHYTMALRNLIDERLPRRTGTVIALSPLNGVLIFRPVASLLGRRSGDSVEELRLIYAGLHRGSPSFRLSIRSRGRSREIEISVADTWRLKDIPDVPTTSDLALEMLGINDQAVSLRVQSSLRFTYEGDWATGGISAASILELPEAQRRLTAWIARQGQVSFHDIASYLGAPESGSHAVVDELLRLGVLQEIAVAGETRFRAHLGRKPGSSLPDEVWTSLGMETPRRPAAGQITDASWPDRAWRLLKGDRSRTVFSLAPVVCLFLITEWLLMQGRVSFAGPLNLVGVAAVSVFAGMFPTLLLVAGRRKGEYVPELVFRFLGWRPIVVGIYLVFLANLFIHGFIIWKQPEEQASAIGMGVLVIVTTLDVFRRRAFAPRSVLELRQAPDGALAFHLVADGRSLPAQAEYEDLTGRRSRADAGDRLPSLEALRQVTFSVPAGHSRYLKIWTHRVTDLGESEPLAVNTTVDGAGETTDMKLSGGSLIVPTRGDTWRVTLVPQQSPALVLS